MSHEFSKEDFDKDFKYLVDEELIEVVGINEQGEWLYAATEKGRALYKSIMALGEDGDVNF